MIRALWRSGAAPVGRAVLFLIAGVLLPSAAEAQSFGRIIGGLLADRFCHPVPRSARTGGLLFCARSWSSRRSGVRAP